MSQEFRAYDKGLLFFIDVDIGFTKDILELCRSYTIPGKSVYYPIVFSMYNPAIVGTPKKRKKKPNPDDEQDEGDNEENDDQEENENESSKKVKKKSSRVTMHQDFGYWRHFGYGMTCQYKEDYLKVGGFNLTIEGWGIRTNI